jgi:hypothetical protein
LYLRAEQYPNMIGHTAQLLLAIGCIGALTGAAGMMQAQAAEYGSPATLGLRVGGGGIFISVLAIAAALLLSNQYG